MTTNKETLRPLKVPKIPEGFLDEPLEEGVSYNETKRLLKEQSGVSDHLKGQSGGLPIRE